MQINIDSQDNRIPLDPTPPQMQDIQVKTKEIALKGKLYTYDDGIVAGENFTVLKNYKYMDIGLEGIFGMSKINTTALTTYLKARSAIHFNKSEPAESHVLVEAWNTGLTAAQILENTTAVPSAGDFSATALWTAASGSSIGRFSTAPGDHVVYANGKEACIWGGNESRVGSFMQHDPNGAYTYDWTDEVRNTLQDSNNVALLQHSTAGGIDAYTQVMLHFNGADADTTITDDSLDSDHDGTCNGNAQLDTAQKKFGTASLLLDGTGDYVELADHADYNFGTGDFTIDMWIRSATPPVPGAWQTLYTQNADDGQNFTTFYIFNSLGTYFLRILFHVAGADVGTYTKEIPLIAGTWHHVAFVRNGTAGYLYFDGDRTGTVEDTPISTNDTGNIAANPMVGNNVGGLAGWNGWIDEFRVSKGIARWTASSFDVQSNAYGENAFYTYVGATRPLSGIKLYIKTANTETSSMIVDHWDGAWTAVSSLSDGTATGGKTLAQTGLITFSSTVATAKPSHIKGKLLYWYRLNVSALSAGIEIYYVTVRAPFQTIKDVWDGSNSLCQSFNVYRSNYEDYTINIQVNEYDSSDALTYVSLDSLSTTQSIVVGFLNRQQGIAFSFGGSKVNANNAAMTVAYWNGEAWTSVSNLTDGTQSGAKSFGQDGVVTWDPPTASSEFKQDLQKGISLYFYRFTFDANLSADIDLFYVRGIEAAKNLYAYTFPFHGAARLWLCYKNYALCSAQDTPDVFNGEDSFTIAFGEDRPLTAACELYCQFGANLYDLLVFAKHNETWVLFQDANGNWQKFRVSGVIGCAANQTMKTVNITPETAAQNGSIAIWQGTHGIYMFDGRVITALHNDIKNYFDRRKSECITAAMIEKSCGFFNDDCTEYHWCFASGSGQTTLNKEFVYVLSKKKWYEVDRTSGKYLQLGITVEDTYGNRYNYGFIDTGYMERLENGTTMDGTAIPYQFAFGDIALAEGHVMYETTVKGVGLAVIGNTTDEARVTVKGYCDTNSQFAETTIDPIAQDDKRVRDVIHSDFDHALGPAVYHKFLFDYTTSTEPYGLRPKYVYINYEINKIKGV